MSLFNSLPSSEKQSSPLLPGCPVAVKLVKAEISKVNAETGKGQDGNLMVSFTGTHIDNAGTSRFVFWLNNFDSENPKYDAKVAANTRDQILAVLEAFAPASEIEYVKASTTYAEILSRSAELLSSKVGSLAKMKIVYKKNSDDDVVIPNFGDFISTELAPRGLVLGSKKGADGVPYDRIHPLSTYGIVAPAANAMPGGFTPPSAMPAFTPPAPAFAAPAAAASAPAFAAPAAASTAPVAAPIAPKA